MSSAPMLIGYIAPPLPAAEGPAAAEEQLSLSRAFASFTQAAASLERAYVQLQSEVARLRHELEDTNRDLAASLEENHRTRQYLDRILQGLPCGVLVTGAGEEVTIANPETGRLLGTNCTTSLPTWVQNLLEQARQCTGEVEYLCLPPSRNGEIAKWITVRRALLDTEDNAGGSIFILQDVSDLKRLQQEHEAMSRRQALAEMSALLAHEMRNPLGSLELFAGLLAESGLPPEERSWVEHLQAGLRTLAATVNNVLHFHSEPTPTRVPTDIGQLLRSTHDFLRPLAKQVRVRLELCQELDGVLVSVDRHRLEQVLLNLALNAFRFMPGGGVLTIRGEAIACDGRAEGMVLEVADTGPGIAASDRERIFQSGFTTCEGSPGLGLAVCRTILQQHGGNITVENSGETGATFRLEFPRPGDSE